MNTRATLLALFALIGFGALAAWSLEAGAGGEDKIGRLLVEAENAYKIGSFHQAITAARQAIGAGAKGDAAVRLEKLIGLSSLRLRRYDEGLKTLENLRQRQPKALADGETMYWISVAWMETGRPPKETLEQVGKTVRILGEEKKTPDQIELLFKAAEYLTPRIGHFELATGTQDWRARQLKGVAVLLDLHDRILALGGTANDQVRALAGKANVAEHHRHLFVDFPREKWPPGIESTYDLSNLRSLAIQFNREIVSRFPDHPSAPAALWRIGEIQSQALPGKTEADFVAALETYRELTKKYPASSEARSAKGLIDQIVLPALSIHVHGPSLPGEKPKYSWHARNVPSIEFAAYPVELIELVRKIEQFDRLQNYPVPSGEPAATWTIETGDTGEHQFLSEDGRRLGRPGSRKGVGDDPPAAPLEKSGAYLVVARGKNKDGRAVEVKSIFLVSRLSLVAKSARTKTAVFVTDGVDGAPPAGATLYHQRLVRTERAPILRVDRNVYEKGQSPIPDGGLLELPHGGPGEPGHREYLLIARHGDDYAVSDSAFHWYWWGFLEGTRGYAYTDRPVYRPNQTVHFKCILRDHAAGAYKNLAGQEFRVEISDPRGGRVLKKSYVAGEFGSISGSVVLGDEPPLGMYRIEVALASGQTVADIGPGANFRVEEYKKPEFQVTLETEKDAVRLGEKVRVKVHGEYYFGGGVANADVAYTVHRRSSPWHWTWPSRYDWFYDGDSGRHGLTFGRGWYPGPVRQDLVTQGKLKTDAFGNAWIEFTAEPFASAPEENVQFEIVARMVDQSRREIEGTKAIKATRRAYNLVARPERGFYQPGDRIRFLAAATNADGQPVAVKAKAALSYVLRREERGEDGKVTKPEKLKPLSTREVELKATSENAIDLVADDAGYYKIELSVPDPFGGASTASTYVWVAKASGELAHYAFRDLEMTLDKETYLAGEKIRVLLTSPAKNAYVLLAAEADDLLLTRIVPVPEGGATTEIDVAPSFRPNLVLTATLLRDNKIFQTQRAVKVPPVESFLAVTLKVPKQTFLPREQAEIEAVVVDHLGKPVRTELSLGCVDASIFYIQPETRGDIRKFFHGRERPNLVRTTSSYGFSGWYRGRHLLFEQHASKDGAGMPMPASAAMESEGAGAAPMLAGRMAKSSEARDQAAGEFQPAEIRKDFRDTVFWAAHLVTGSDGRAKAKIRFPDSLTTWRLTAVAADPSTAVGEVKEEVVTKKNVIVRLQAPRFFVERDKVVLSAIAHNYLDKEKTVRVRLESSPELALLAAAVDDVMEKTSPPAQARELDVVVPPGGEKRVDFLASCLRPGEVKLLAQALTDSESDALEKTYPVIEYGAEKLLAQSGVVRSTTEGEQSLRVHVEIPEAIRAGSARLTVKLSPTIGGVVLEAIPYLIDYPYGCTEQTMSRFLPAALASRTLKKVGVDLASLRKIDASDPSTRRRLERFRKNPVYDSKELERVVAAGLRRLADFQQADGGWGWWKNDSSNPYLTAYVVSGLATARDAGVAAPAGMIERGVGFLANQVVRPEAVRRYPWLAAEDSSLLVYMLYAVGRAEPARLAQPAIKARLRKSYEDREELNDYSRALLVLVLNQAGLREETQIALDNLKDRARIDAQTETASWGDDSGYYYWYQSGTEATSFSLKALLAVEPSSPLVVQAVNWLVRHRSGTRWFSTKDTALVCDALGEYLATSGELDPDVEYRVEMAGVSKTVRVNRDNLFSFDGEIELAGDAVGPGRKEIVLTKKGRGNLYWGAYATFFTKEDRIAEAGSEIHVRRAYERLTPREVEKTRQVYDRASGKPVAEKYKEIEYDRSPLEEGDKLESGDLVEVVLDIEAKNNFEYLLFEDPKPAGCEATELRSGYAWGNGLGSHMELRDERVAFFATYLNQGKHRIAYRLRAEIPGEFHALPARAECMYAPLVRGNSASRVLRVVEAR